MLGHGAIGAEHARALNSLGCVLVTVMGPDLAQAEQFAAEHGFGRASICIEDVFDATDIDAVVVASPNAEHAAQATAALRRGKHVLCEVPLGMSLSEVRQVEATLAGRDLVCMACHTQRFLPPIGRLRELVSTGSFAPLSLAGITGLYRRENVGWTGKPRDWVDSLVWHHGAHAVDTALWLLDDKVHTVRAMRGRPDPRTAMPMDISVSITTQAGRLATLALSYNAFTTINELVFIGDSDSYRIHDWTLANAAGEQLYEPTDALLRAAVYRQDELFVQNVMGDLRDGPSVADVLPVYRTLQRIHDEIEGAQG
jgi:2-hydroxy-4-carboxymuconate semialdehyde hemiacetal dehydrogenase